MGVRMNDDEWDDHCKTHRTVNLNLDREHWRRVYAGQALGSLLSYAAVEPSPTDETVTKVSLVALQYADALVARMFDDDE